MKLLIKGVEQLRPPKGIKEWGAGEPHEDKKMEKSVIDPKDVSQPGGPGTRRAGLEAAHYGHRTGVSVEHMKNMIPHMKQNKYHPDYIDGFAHGIDNPPAKKGNPMAKANTKKAYPMGEGPKQTAGGGQIWMQKIPQGKKPPEKKKIDLGTAPMMSTGKSVDKDCSSPLKDMISKAELSARAKAQSHMAHHMAMATKLRSSGLQRAGDAHHYAAVAIRDALSGKDTNLARVSKHSRGAYNDFPESYHVQAAPVGGVKSGIEHATLQSAVKESHVTSPMMSVKKGIEKLILSSMLSKAGGSTGSDLGKDYGYGGSDEARGLTKPFTPTLPSIVRKDPKAKHDKKHPTKESPAISKACAPMAKDMEHLAGENKKIAPASPTTVATQSKQLGFSKPAMFQGSGERKTALGMSKPVQGATGAVKDAPEGVLTSAPAEPVEKPKTPSFKPGQVISMHSVASKPPAIPKPKQAAAMKSVTKSAIEVLKGMIDKVSSLPGNPANVSRQKPEMDPPGNKSNMRGPVSGSEGPGNDSQQNGSVQGSPSPGCEGKKQGPMDIMHHGGKGPAQTSVGVMEEPGNASQMNKAMGAGSIPRMPRAMAMAMDTWRSATNVLTRGNSAFSAHAGTGPLHAELVEQIDEPTYDRGTRHGPVLKSCGGCGRTYTLRKSDDGCPSCSSLPLSNMSKSRGGYLIPSSISE